MQKDRFSKLRGYYLLALSTIALSMIIGQFLVQHHLRMQEGDAQLINLAGRQRMLSQQISKIVLKIDRFHEKNDALLPALKMANDEWHTNHVQLQQNEKHFSAPLMVDKQAAELIDQNNAVFYKIWNASTAIYNQLKKDPSSSASQLDQKIQIILENEATFLATMDIIVGRLEFSAAQKVVVLRRMEYLLFGISLFIILFEIIFIFLPTTKRVNETLLKLIKSEHDAQQMSKEISALYASLEASYERISGITLPVAPPKLIARADQGGNLFYVSDGYAKHFISDRIQLRKTIAQLFGFQGEEANDFNDQLIDVVTNEANWHKELVYNDNDGNKRYMDVFVVPTYDEQSEVVTLLVLAADLTPRRLAEQNMYKKDRAEIEKRINEQKFRSVLVLEGQEEERKRMAMNIHDGIGQLLTSLKFQIASIDLRKTADATKKLEDINALIRDIIQEVRRVTFNLKPPVLSDYGIVAGLKNLVQEIDKLSGQHVLFENKTDFNRRLPAKVENNIYRIVQEAVNNAIKYAHSDRIEVSVAHETQQLLVSIKDYGVGFEHKQVDLFHVDYGHGFLNMQERAAYINGALSIESAKGVGTIIKLFVPLVLNAENTLYE